MDIGTAMLMSTGANILAGAFNSGSGGNKRNQRDYLEVQQKYGEPNRRENATWNLENVYGKSIQTKVADAKAAGLHPLFAMGSPGASAGPSYASPMPGQSSEGNFKSNGLAAIAKGFGQIATYQAEADLIDKMNEKQALNQAERQLSNDTAGAMADRAVKLSKVPYEQALKSKNLAEYEPAKVGSHDQNNPTSTGSVSSLTSGIRIGDQVIQTMAQEGAEIAEDPAIMIGAAMLDKANRHIDWKRAIRDYTGMSHPRGYGPERDSDVVRTKKYLWGLLKLSRSYQRTRGQGR